MTRTTTLTCDLCGTSWTPGTEPLRPTQRDRRELWSISVFGDLSGYFRATGMKMLTAEVCRACLEARALVGVDTTDPVAVSASKAAMAKTPAERVLELLQEMHATLHETDPDFEVKS